MAEYESLYYAGHIIALFAVSIIVGKIAGPIVTRILETLSGKTASTLDDRIIAAVKNPLETFFFLILFYFLLHISPDLADAAALLEHYLAVILTLIGTYMLSEVSGAAIRWYYEEGQTTTHLGKRMQKLGVDNSLLPLVRKVTKLAIYVIGITLAISQAGFDVGGLLAVTSVTALILGLASQETLGNIFAGIALQLDRPYHYGDYIRLPSGEIAIVKKIGMRSTKLEDIYHNTIILSNSEFAKMRVTNLSLPDEISLVPVSAEVPLSTDLVKLDSAITHAFAKAKPEGLLSDKKHEIVIDSVKPSSMAISISFWAKGFRNAEKIRQIVNRTIVEFTKHK
ncbi:MAG: mechanosensitive ion channel family protein [Candidatus Micrarchaeota archaeon]|nr:mechanosensitive ion channel family protein [Candidatus Micrarchaeota archaeon]